MKLSWALALALGSAALVGAEVIVVDHSGIPWAGSDQLLVSWEADDGRSGELASAIDIARMRWIEAAAGPVWLTRREGDGLVRETLPVTSWRLDVLPVAVDRELASALRSVRDGEALAGLVDRVDAALAELVGSGQAGPALWLAMAASRAAEVAGDEISGGRWKAAADALEVPPTERAMARLDHGMELFKSGRVDAGIAEVRAGLATAEGLGGAAESALHCALASVLDWSGSIPEAKVEADRCRSGYAGSASALLVGTSLNIRATIAYREGDLETAEDLWGEMAAIYRELDPSCRDAGVALNNMAMVNATAGRHDEAARLYREALGVIERSDGPESVGVAQISNNLGNLARESGDLDEAERLLRRSAELRKLHQPGSLGVARTLNNLALLLIERVRYGEAERMLAEGAEILDGIERPTLEAVANGGYRSRIALNRHDYETALVLAEESRATIRELVPDSLDEAVAIADVALCRSAAGDLEGAGRELAAAMALVDGLAPEGHQAIKTALSVAINLVDQGRTEEAGEIAERTRELADRVAPRATVSAVLWLLQARIALARGDAETCLEHVDRAAAISRDPAAPWNIEAAMLRAQALESLGRRSDALSVVREIPVLASQLVGASGAATLSGRPAAVDQEARTRWVVDAVSRLGGADDAFAAFEQTRSLALRELDRGGRLPAIVPVDLQARRQRVELEYSRALAALHGAESGDAEVLERLVKARDERSLVHSLLADASATLARSVDPPPTPAQVARALPEGSLYLLYAIGEASVIRVVISSEGDARSSRLEVAPESLRSLVRRYRLLLESGAPESDLAARLGELLLPAGTDWGSVAALVVAPDGVLNHLPFPALVVPDGSGRRLVETSRSWVVASAWEVVRGDGGPRRLRSLVALADPTLGAGSGGPRRRGDELGALPGSRVEAEAVAALFEDGRVFLGEEATRERLLSTVDADVVHLACHGLVDEALPLESGLLLAGDDHRGGVLHAWEVVEELAVPGALVTLSACRSGLGQTRVGFGAFGLVQAFHLAGARTVVASLWDVDDTATAALMTAFYGRLRGGENAAAALRSAQRSLLDGSAAEPGWQHPRAWAGFYVSGHP